MRTSAKDADDAGSAEALRGADVDLADVERVLGGDVNAFEGLVRRWQGPLVRRCGATAVIVGAPKRWRRKRS